MTIPEWDINKILPPIHPDTPEGFEHDLLYRAPYVARLEEFITRFVTTPERGNLMERFLAYRAALHQWDVTEGFQWINGSFVENLEQSSYPRPPRDIDVVTFYYGNDNHAFYRNLMNPDLASQEFNVDAYGVELGEPLDIPTVTLIGHLHSLWSHRRGDRLWKGFIQVDLDPEEDPPARDKLEALKEVL